MAKRVDTLQSDPRPARMLRASLRASRSRGESFARAWPLALGAALAAAPTPLEREHWPLRAVRDEAGVASRV